MKARKMIELRIDARARFAKSLEGLINKAATDVAGSAVDSLIYGRSDIKENQCFADFVHYYHNKRTIYDLCNSEVEFLKAVLKALDEKASDEIA